MASIPTIIPELEKAFSLFLTQLARGLEGEDLRQHRVSEALRGMFHQIRGASGIFGLNDLGELAKEVELEVKRGLEGLEVNWELVDERVAALKVEAARLSAVTTGERDA